MKLEEFAWHLTDLLEHTNTAYLKSEPDVLDFTSGSGGKIVVQSHNKRVEYEIDPTEESVRSVLALFEETIFDPENLKMLFCWNLKSLLSFFRHFVPKVVTPRVSIVDLQPIENFLNLRKMPPKTAVEALNRGKIVSKLPAWKPIYQKIHLPLSLRVLPALETTPLLSKETKGPVYAHYEIEGQINGRMNNYKKFERSYLPYTMGPDVKASLTPRGERVRFVTADFRGCEVAVLQWLTQDPALAKILEQSDIHKAMYEELTGDECDSDKKRSMSKRLFLPVMYGLGPTGLANNMGLNVEVAKDLILRIRKRFAVAWDWMFQRQREAQTGFVTDHFGRPRKFPEGKAYLARNFSVQGVAATVCLEKLIALHEALASVEAYICFSVHDGYGMACQIEAAKNVYQIVKRTLESESKVCDGLRMRAEIKFGARLDAMKVLWKD